MRVVILGGTGHLGRILERHLSEAGHDVEIVGRSVDRPALRWDGRSLGPWARAIDGADAVINLAGRSVNCRYTEKNLREMRDSRVLSTRIAGRAISQASQPPRVWLQMSTATIYAHTFGEAHDESSAHLGGHEPDAPADWRTSVEIARHWENELEQADTPHTRKVILRTSMVMSAEPGGAFVPLRTLARLGLGGAIAGGEQYVSWIHEIDFVRVIEHLLDDESIDGIVNVAAPNPIPQRQFMAELREALGMPLAIPATGWMIKVGAFVGRTESELLLKSRRVVSRVLRESGFRFAFSTWQSASRDLVAPQAVGQESTVEPWRDYLFAGISGICWGLLALAVSAYWDYWQGATLSRDPSFLGGLMASPLIGLAIGRLNRALRPRSKLSLLAVSLLNLYVAAFLFAIACAVTTTTLNLNSQVPHLLFNIYSWTWSIFFGVTFLFPWLFFPASALNHYLMHRHRLRA